jgi:hypothetical protein
MKYALFVIFLLTATGAHGGGIDQDSDARVSKALATMEMDGHTACLLSGISDYYGKHISAVNLIETMPDHRS